jgi:hypothetical protein
MSVGVGFGLSASVLSVRGLQVTQGGLFTKKAHRCLDVVLFALFCVTVTQVQAQDTDDRRYTLADHGSLQLRVPTVGQEVLQQDRDQLLPAIVCTEKSGRRVASSCTDLADREKRPQPGSHGVPEASGACGRTGQIAGRGEDDRGHGIPKRYGSRVVLFGD